MKHLLIIFALLAVGCAEDKYEEFYKAVERTEKGKESVWLEVDTMSGTDRTVLFFGYYDNMLACEETAEMYEERYGRNYRCQRVKD